MLQDMLRYKLEFFLEVRVHAHMKPLVQHRTRVKETGNSNRSSSNRGGLAELVPTAKPWFLSFARCCGG